MKYLLERYNEQFLSNRIIIFLGTLTNSDDKELQDCAAELTNAYDQFKLAHNKKDEPISFTEEQRTRFFSATDTKASGYWSKFMICLHYPQFIQISRELDQLKQRRRDLFEESKKSFIEAEQALIQALEKRPESLQDLVNKKMLMQKNDPSESRTRFCGMF